MPINPYNGSGSGGGSGDVTGPASSTDNAIVRYDGTTGKVVQNSGVTIDDSDNVTGIADLTITGTLNGITPSDIVESGDNVSDLANDAGYITASSTDTLTNKTFDANGTGNSISNIETADIASASKTGADTTIVTGTAGTGGNLIEWDSNGDAIDSGISASDVILAEADLEVFKAIGTSTADPSAADVDLTWATPEITGSDYSLAANNTDITVNTTTNYLISCQVGVDFANRTGLAVQLFKDTGSGFAALTNEVTRNYSTRNNNINEGAITLTTIVALDSGDKIKAVASCITETADTAALVPALTKISIARLKGAKGDTGPAGGIGGSTGATDNALLRADGTGGSTIQASNVIIDDSDNITGVESLATNSDISAGAGKFNYDTATNIIELQELDSTLNAFELTGVAGGGKWHLRRGGNNQIQMSAVGSTKFNMQNVTTHDFIVNGSSDNLLYCDSSTDRVGINTATPSEAFDVVGNIAVTGTVDGRDIAADGAELDTISGSYITASSTDTLTNKTFDANGTGNSLSNVDLSADVIGNLPVTNLNGGTGASSSTFWRGDGAWAAVSGGVVQTQSTSTSSVLSTTTQIPFDTSLPTSTEGAQALSQAITPTSASNTVKVTVNGFAANSSSGNVTTIAVFRGTTCIKAIPCFNNANQDGIPFSIIIIDSPATTSSTTYSVRYGPEAATTAYLNSNFSGTAYYGTAGRTDLILEEISV